MDKSNIKLISPLKLIHIEDFSNSRVEWLREKILKEGIWTRPVAVDKDNYLVMDGQHRMEVALQLSLKLIPVVFFSYKEIDISSLRLEFEFDWKMVVERALNKNPYPYKTVHHNFPDGSLPDCNFLLEELK